MRGKLETFVETFAEKINSGHFLEIPGRVIGRRLAGTGGPCSVCAVDLGVDGAVVVTKAEDSVSGIRQDGRERVGSAPPWPVEHLRLKLAKFVLQIGELVGEGLKASLAGRTFETQVCQIRASDRGTRWGGSQ